MNFAIANPARQVFFTVVGREEKYKAKNLIDVVVYRGSDALYGWVFDSLQALGLKLGAHRAVRAAGRRPAGWCCRSRSDAGRSAAREQQVAVATTEIDMILAMTRREFVGVGRRRRRWRRTRWRRPLTRDAHAAPYRRAANAFRRWASAPQACSIATSDATQRTRHRCMHALLASGGRLIDTASTYGDAEVVLGKAIAAENLRDKIFIATKVEAPDDAELKRSLARLRTPKVDLLQLHNVRDTRQSLARFREWKAQGSAAISASPRPTTAISTLWRPCSAAKSPISCRSTIRWTSAGSRRGSCRSRPMSVPAC